MNKQELEELLDKLKIAVNEGIQSDTNTNVYPRIVYWDFVWEPLMASGDEYNTKVTYQISFFAEISRHPKLIELRNLFKEKKIYPIFEHEYVQDKKEWHSFFAIEVLENV